MFAQSRRRVVVTGIGVVSPNGVGRERFTAALREGRSGLSSLEGRIDTRGLKSWAAGQVLDFDPAYVLSPAELKRVPRMVPLALAASREALKQANLQALIDGTTSSPRQSPAVPPRARTSLDNDAS